MSMKMKKKLAPALFLSAYACMGSSLVFAESVTGSEVKLDSAALNSIESDQQLISSLTNIIMLAKDAISKGEILTENYTVALKAAQKASVTCRIFSETAFVKKEFEYIHDRYCKKGLKELEKLSEVIAEVVDSLPADVKKRLEFIKAAELAIRLIKENQITRGAFNKAEHSLQDVAAAKSASDE